MEYGGLQITSPLPGSKIGEPASFLLMAEIDVAHGRLACQRRQERRTRLAKRETLDGTEKTDGLTRKEVRDVERNSWVTSIAV